jgi:hypothetical protein
MCILGTAARQIRKKIPKKVQRSAVPSQRRRSASGTPEIDPKATNF